MDKFLPDTFYHIFHRANGNEQLFRTPENYRFFLQQYAKYIDPVCITYAWCLLPNHFHFLIKTRSTFAKLETLQKFKEETLQKFDDLRISRQFASLLSSYTQAFNKVNSRKGSLFMRNMKRKLIDDHDYLTKTLCYIHHNPIHHGFTKNLTMWPFTSYNQFISDEQALMSIPYKEVINWFDSLDNFYYAHKHSLEEKMNLLMYPEE